MPNWCEADLDVEGEPTVLSRFLKAAQGEWGCLDANKFIPYPEQFRLLDEAAAVYEREHPGNWKGRPKDGFNQGGCEWCVENWGTKWDFGDPELVGQSSEALEYTFATAWSPPLPVIKKMSEMFPELTFSLHYYEGAMEFQGTYVCKGGNVEEDTQSAYSGDRGG